MYPIIMAMLIILAIILIISSILESIWVYKANQFIKYYKVGTREYYKYMFQNVSKCFTYVSK